MRENNKPLRLCDSAGESPTENSEEPKKRVRFGFRSRDFSRTACSDAFAPLRLCVRLTPSGRGLTQRRKVIRKGATMKRDASRIFDPWLQGRRAKWCDPLDRGRSADGAGQCRELNARISENAAPYSQSTPATPSSILRARKGACKQCREPSRAGTPASCPPSARDAPQAAP